MKKDFGKIAVEFLSIVFAVLLALALNSLKQQYDLKKESKLLTAKIIKESHKNMVLLDSVNITNANFKLYLDSLLDSPTDSLTTFTLGFSNELLSSSAWVYTQNANSYTHLNSDFLDDAIELYEMQGYYMMISNMMFENLGNMLLRAEKLKPSPC